MTAGDGAVLAWGDPFSSGGGVHALALDPLGTARGIAVDVVRSVGRDGVPAQVEELALGSHGGRVGLAWIVGGRAPEAFATFSRDTVEGFAPASSLGATVSLTAGQPARHARLAIAPREDGALMVSHRGTDGPCSSETVGPSCAHVAAAQLDALQAAVAATDTMEVPTACDGLLVGAASAGGTWFYGLCHLLDGQPVTTMYAIRPSISYAAANEALAGCTPESMVALDDGVALVASCGGARRVAFLDGTGRVTQVAEQERAVTCEGDGRPVLSLAVGNPRRLALRGSLARVEGLLPDDVAPSGSRAVWTGEALLVAVPLTREVSLHRFQCRRGTLTRTDIP